ncbi:MAG: helix-turn-helix domain-containing protein [bacterium]|nr:helix-turn-helix domain-containing protein [bacterium]
MLDKIIENFNLEEKEAKVYLAALGLGKTRVSEIAKKAGLNRITTYEILKRLKQKGLANSAVYKDILVFQVIGPERFIEKMESRLALSKILLPQLMLFGNNKKSRPKIEFYDGTEGIKSIYEATLFCKEKIIYNVAHPENLLNTISEDFFNNYVKKRVKKKIRVRVLLTDVKLSEQYKKEGIKVMRETKVFNYEKYPISNEIMVYDNKIVLLSFRSKIGVIIEDVELAMSMKSIWNFIWNSLPN